MNNLREQERCPDGDSTELKRTNQATRFSKDRQPNRKLIQEPVPLLEAMNWVLTHSRGHDTHGTHRQVRRWMEKDIKGFMTKLADLELRKGSGAEKPQGEVDEGLERAIQTCEEWLKYWAAQHPEANQ
jgi:hypothetical protein